MSLITLMFQLLWMLSCTYSLIYSSNMAICSYNWNYGELLCCLTRIQSATASTNRSPM